MTCYQPDHCLNINDIGTSAAVPLQQIFLTLINTLVASRCTLSDNREQYPKDSSATIQDGMEFDFIIVGGGTAGSVVANRVSENPKWNVLLVEAGGLPSSTSEVPGLRFQTLRSPENWNSTYEPTPNACNGFQIGRCLLPRGRVLGGTSSINGMIYLRGNRQDYNQWSELGNPGWNYDALVPHFLNIENLKDLEIDPDGSFYGRDGYLPLTKYKSRQPITGYLAQSAKEFGLHFLNHESGLGYIESTQAIYDGTRYSSAKAFLSSVIKSRPNLKVILNSRVLKLNFNKEKDRVLGVQVKVGTNLVNLKVKNDVILSAGVVGSPQILLHSGIGPKEQLEEFGIDLVRNLAVGENLQDHVTFLGFLVKVRDQAVVPPSTLDDTYQYFAYKTGPLAEIGINNFMGFINTRRGTTSKYPNIQLQHHLMQKGQIKSPLTLGFNEEIIKIMQEANKDYSILEILPAVLNPKSRGFLRLQSVDPEVPPKIYSNSFSNPHDVEVLLEGIRFIEELLTKNPIRNHIAGIINFNFGECKNLKFRSDAYWECLVKYLGFAEYHTVGTCKMGPKTDPKAVVNARLKVHGVKNLRVIDASIMPRIVSVNTMGACLVIGQKGGDMVLEDWGYHPKK